MFDTKKKYRCVKADPPWNHVTWTDKGKEGRPQHYSRMSIDDICAMPVVDICHDDCWLFLWTTSPHLEQAFRVMHAWGFTYSSMGFVWIKVNKTPAAYVKTAKGVVVPAYTSQDLFTGQGYTTRKNAEFCLLGRRGKPKRLSKSIHEVIVAQRREHSRKPDEAYDRVKKYCAGPRIELFSRENRAGFDVWGNEVGKFE